MLAKRGLPQPSVPPRDAECCWPQSYKNHAAGSSDGLGNRIGEICNCADEGPVYAAKIAGDSSYLAWFRT